MYFVRVDPLSVVSDDLVVYLCQDFLSLLSLCSPSQWRAVVPDECLHHPRVETQGLCVCVCVCVCVNGECVWGSIVCRGGWQ